MRLESVTPPAPRILGLDIENEPDWYGGGDFVYDRIVCVSRKWVGETGINTNLIDWRDSDGAIVRQLAALRADIESADAFLGHNFGHDRKGIVMLFAHLKTPFLDIEEKPVIDTMRCIPSGPARSLEHLCAFYGLGEKPHLTNHDWTLALKRWDKASLVKVIERNRADVLLTEALYRKEQELGYLP